MKKTILSTGFVFAAMFSLNAQNININLNLDDYGFTTKQNDSSNATISQTNTATTVSSATNFVPNGTMCSVSTLNATQFLALKYNIDQQNTFTKKKYLLAEIKKNCLTAEQVSNLVKMSSSIDRLEVAKQAYLHSIDTENYMVVTTHLTSTQKQNLLDFLSTSGSSSTTITTTNTINVNTDTVVTTNLTESPTVVYVDGYGGATGCNVPESDVSNILNALKSESFADDKMNVAKQALKNRCIKVEHVKLLMNEFSFAEDKLAFAKYAYDYTYDIENYYQVSSDFTFSADKQELNEFIMSK